jgi:ATP-dependent DNA helicase RecG
MIEVYKDSPDELQPVVSIYPGFLNLKLYDRLYRNESIEIDLEGLDDPEKVVAILKVEGPKSVKSLQESINYNSRSSFLKEVINPLIESGDIFRDGKPKSPTSLIKIKKT